MVRIHFDDVCQSFDSREVLHHLTCSFDGGCVTAVAGTNGSGKSTLLHLAARLTHPTSGQVDTFLDDRAVMGAEYRSMLAMAMPEMELYTRLTVRENLSFLLGARGVSSEEQVLQELLARMGLSAEVLSRRAGTLSTGMRQRVRLAVLLGSDAAVWLLDEPGLALDVHGRSLLLCEVRAAAERGRTILWATNDREEREAADACIDLSSGTAGRL